MLDTSPDNSDRFNIWPYYFLGFVAVLVGLVLFLVIACFQFSPSTSIASWAADRRSAPS